nr:hypothetical protein [Tanacetum cinerariifolium]
MRPNMFIDITIRVSNASSLINLRVAFHAINDHRLPLAPLVYTLARPSVMSGRIVLSIEDKLNYLEQPIPPVLVAPASQAEQELLQTMRDFHSCKQEEGQSVSSYVLKIKGHIDNLERLGMEKTVNELHAMLKLYQQTLPKSNAPALNPIQAGKFVPKPKIPPPPKRENLAKDSIYHECGEIGHWKRNCSQYLAELMKKKKNTASGAGGSGSKGYNKRAKLDLDSALLWHCRLRHISKKRIEKLQHDGLLSSSDLTSFEKCVSCMFGKMARKPYTHQVERAKDLLGLIHTDNRGKAIVNSPQPIFDQEPSMVDEDDETSKDKEINKLMALISLSFKKIYKPTNNNLQNSSNTSRTNQDNSPRINRNAGYENQRIGNIAGARETVEVSLDAADSVPIFDDEPMQKVSNDDHCNVFAMESAHPEQSKPVHDTYPIEQDTQDVIIDSLDMNYDREEIDQNDDDNDLAKERELLASLIEKLKCEIEESKNRNKFLETSNKVLIENLKGEIEDFKNKKKV